MRKYTRIPISQRFWSKVRIGDGCWEWTASTHKFGYGQLFVEWKARPLQAHRVSWELHFGEIPKGKHVLHKCDNPLCVRPDHLFLGTHEDNLSDMNRKGRHFSKLPIEAVISLRDGSMSPKEASKKFGVHPRYGYLVKRRTTWNGIQ